jgi:pyroglutamyl-peptidase
MAFTILLTGFGPFPGAPFNPTEPLVQELARKRFPGVGTVRAATHIFNVSYGAVDRELPALIEKERPDALIMFGLAVRTKHVRIETRARNALSRTLSDAEGCLPSTSTIVPGGPAALALRTPAQRLLVAVRSIGLPVKISHDAGHYLCNYLCWRAAESARKGMPRITSFIHVPNLHRRQWPRACGVSLDDLTTAGAAIMRVVTSSARFA